MPTLAGILLWYVDIAPAQMAVPLSYAVVFGCILALWLLVSFGIRLITWTWVRSSFFLLKYLIYPHLFGRLPYIGAATGLEYLAITLYIAANILCIFIPWASWADISRRAGTMSIINTIPLLCGPRLVLMTELLRIPFQAHLGLHKWIGRTAVAHAILHAVLSVIQSQPLSWTPVNLTGVIGVSSLGLLVVLSLSPVPRFLYEWFLRSHLVFTIVALSAIWLHLSSKKPLGLGFLQIGIILWTIAILIHGIYFMFRNLALGRYFGTARIKARTGAIEITVKVARPWNVKAGEWIFLSIPAAGATSALQSHPFMIIWWDRDVNGLTLSLLVKPRRGFTRRLASMAGRELIALIDGPYGPELQLGEYGTVLMFATGIGIAGHIPYIKALIRGYNSCEIRTRRIILVWQLSDEEHLDWVKQWMDELIQMDTGFILKTLLYVLKRSHNLKVGTDEPKGLYLPGEIIPYSDHDKLDKIFAFADVEEILDSEFKSRHGKMVVSVCSDNTMADQVRQAVQKNMDPGLRLVQLDFQPSLRNTRRRTTDLEFGCRGVA